MERFEKLSSMVYELIDDVERETVVVHQKVLARNSLYLLRDSLLDLRYTYSLVTELGEKRINLMREQVRLEVFSGELHDSYHEVSGQLRAANVAVFQAGKRMLNNSSHVLGCFLPHGVDVKVGSFGRQYGSAKSLKQAGLDKRSRRLIKNILVHGAKLEIYNDARDMYVEHSKPAAKSKQGRPINMGTGIHYMTENQRPDFFGVEELQFAGRLRKAGPDYVGFGSEGNDDVELYHVHVGHVRALMDHKQRPVFFMKPPDRDPRHFKSLEPHVHAFPKNEDTVLSALDASLTLTELSSANEMIDDFCAYVGRMLEIINKNK